MLLFWFEIDIQDHGLKASGFSRLMTVLDHQV